MPQYMRTLQFWVGLSILLASPYVYYLGHTIHTIDPKVDRTAFIAAIWTHVGYATLLFMPVTLYLILDRKKRLSANFQKSEAWVIRFFKITFALKLITGPLAVWTRGSTWKVFDWFGIPSPVERMNGPHEFIEHVHSLLGYPLILFFGMSVLIIGRHIYLSMKIKTHA